MRDAVRRDDIHWLEPPGAGAAQQACLARFEALRQSLNRALQLGLLDFECHYARYAPGAFYRRHLDRLAGDDRRALSCILYLNDAWLPEDGGHLRLYLGTDSLDVPPEGGTLAICYRERNHVEFVEPRSGRVRGRVEGHTGGVGGLAFSPDGHRLARASGDESVRLWVVETRYRRAFRHS